jgi:hypothetical protein
MPQESPAQLSLVSLLRLRMLGAQSTQEGELPTSRTSLSRGREFFWQEEVHAEDSPWMLAYVAGECRRTLESALCCALSRCPFYVLQVFLSYVI